MSWTDFDLAKPDGSTGSGATVISSIHDNQHALWNFLMMGGAKGMLLSVSGGTAEEPGTITLSNGTNRLKGVITWASGNFSSIVWSSSQDNGSSYSTICTQGFTYDGSGNLTATTGAGGLLAFVAYLLGRKKAHDTSIASLVATLATLTGMAFQDPSAVAITGGTIKGVVLGGTGAGEAKLATVLATRNTVVDLGGGTPANTFTIDWNAGNSFRCAPGANFTFAETNAPANGFAQEVTLEISGGAGFTATLPSGYGWGSAGAPTFTAGPDLIRVYRRGHATTPTKRFVTLSLA